MNSSFFLFSRRGLFFYVLCVVLLAECVVFADTRAAGEVAEKTLKDIMESERLIQHVESGAVEMVLQLQRGKSAAKKAEEAHLKAAGVSRFTYPSAWLTEARRSAKAAESELKRAAEMASYVEGAMKREAAREWATRRGGEQAQLLADMTEATRVKANKLLLAYDAAERTLKANTTALLAVRALEKVVNEINDIQKKDSSAPRQNLHQVTQHDLQRVKLSVARALSLAKDADEAADKAEMAAAANEVSEMANSALWLKSFSSDALERLQDAKKDLSTAKNSEIQEHIVINIKKALEAEKNASDEAVFIVDGSRRAADTAAKGLSTNVGKALTKAQEVREIVVEALKERKAILKKAADEVRARIVTAGKTVGRLDEFWVDDSSVFVPYNFTTFLQYYVLVVIVFFFCW